MLHSHDPLSNLRGNLAPLEVPYSNALSSIVSLNNEYLFLRHGRAESNELRVVSCDPKICISQHGLVESGKELARQEFARAIEAGVLNSDVFFVSSDFRRAAETAQIGMEMTGATRVLYTPALRERNLGDLHQTPGDLVHGHISEADQKNVFNKTNPLNGMLSVESPAEVQRRMTSLVAYLESAFEGQRFVMVSHHDPIRILQTGFLQQAPNEYMQLPKVPNCTLQYPEFVPGVDESKSFSRDILKSQEFRSLLEDPSSRGSDIVALAKRHPVINYALNAKPRTAYIMDTEPHTVCVIDQFNKYFPDFSSSHLSRAGMVLMLLLHDIGKDMQTPLMSQHATTLNVIEEISKDLPLSDQELRVVRGVIDGDVLGSYAQKFLRKPASEPRRALAHLIEAGDLTGAHYRAYLEMFEVMSVTEEQRAMFKQDALLDFAAQASEAGLSAQELYPIVMPYYCCDLSGYSLDAGAYPALEGFWQFAQEIDSDRVITFANRPSIMLVRKENRPRLLFTPVVEQAMVDFEAALGV